MTNPSETRDSELIARGAALKARVLSLPEDASNMDLIADLAEWAADCYDFAQAASAIGEPVAWLVGRTDRDGKSGLYLPLLRGREEMERYTKNNPDETLVPLYASPTPSDHVAVPVALTYEDQRLLKLMRGTATAWEAATTMKLANPPSSAQTLRKAIALIERLAALPNQGETKP